MSLQKQMTKKTFFLIHEKVMNIYLIFNVFLSMELVLKLVDSSTNKKLKHTRISELI